MAGDLPPGGFLTLSDVERAARARLPDDVWAYIQGGAGEEKTLGTNRAAFDRWDLRPSALAGIEAVDLRTRLLDDSVTVPFFVAPTAYHGLVLPEGEVATARGAAETGTLAVFSTLSSRSLEDIARATPAGPRWFQLYLQPEFDRTRELVQRAEAAGFHAIVLTVDAPVLGPRDRQTRDGVAIRSPVPIGNGPHIRAPARGPEFRDQVYRFPPDAAHGWETLGRLREMTRLPVVVKGILTPEDARRAVSGGARAVVVSNHGGRQLDRSVPTLEALPDVVAAVGTRAEVYVDGGVRRGSDILIALALGAKGVGIGRPVLWALAAGGSDGVRRLLSLFASELAVCMHLAGLGRPADVDSTILRRAV